MDNIPYRTEPIYYDVSHQGKHIDNLLTLCDNEIKAFQEFNINGTIIRTTLTLTYKFINIVDSIQCC